MRGYNQKEDRLSGQINDDQKRIGEYENRTIVLSKEVERLNDILTKMNSENGDMKRKTNEMEFMKSTIVTLEEKFSSAVHENEGLRQGVN